jgi:hypothetical protein
MHKYGVTVNAIMPGAATRMTDSIPAGRMPGASGLAASESAEGTPRDPANVAPIVVYLASDQAAEVTGQCFGASGYRISRYTHMKMDRTIISDGPWDIDKLFDIFKSTLGQSLEAVNMFG